LIAVTKERHAQQRLIWDREMMKSGAQIPVATGSLLFFLGMGLYWGEGTKNEHDPIVFSNSDPRAIRAYLAFLRETGADLAKLCASLVIHQDIDREKALAFWSKASGIAPNRISVTQIASHENPRRRSRGTLNVKLSDIDFSRKAHGQLRGVIGQFVCPGETDRPLMKRHTLGD
jgi:hypothetical protein